MKESKTPKDLIKKDFKLMFEAGGYEFEEENEDIIKAFKAGHIQALEDVEKLLSNYVKKEDLPTKEEIEHLSQCIERGMIKENDIFDARATIKKLEKLRGGE